MDLKTYVKENGGQTDFARKLGVTQGLVWQWLNGETRVTAERAIEIDKFTGGLVDRATLRPDIFGPGA